MKHILVFTHNNRCAAILIFKKSIVHLVKGARAMVLRPVKFNAAANPRPRKSYKGRLDNLIVIYKVIVSCFVVRSLHSATELGQNHYLEIIIFKEYRFVFFVNFFIADFVNNRVRINFAA